jgi:predicted Rossmann fold flavoprotein
VIGGGAAGMMAALTAAQRGRDVLLLEHEKFCGRKLRITGKGRCNVCNDCDVRTVLQHVPRNPKFLYGALSRFTPADTMAFFESLGVPLKTERGNRVFPCSDNAHDIANALERAVKRAGVRLVTAEARELLTEDGAVRGVRTSAGDIACESALLATGGASYPLTGSTGDGYRMAAALGHRVTPLRPSLVPLVCEDACCRELQGFSLKNVTLRAFDGDGRLLFSELGEMLFTHFGVSGPLVLSASAHLRGPEGARYRLEIDLKPGLDEQQLDARLLRDFAKYKNRDFANALGDLAGRTMIPVLVRRSGIPPETKVNAITHEQRRALLALFKAFPLTVTGPVGLEQAIVTSGGVDVSEVDPRTMRSKRVPGLYFAGEILDVDAYTGGFNLQIAWSTGHLAGENI